MRAGRRMRGAGFAPAFALLWLALLPVGGAHAQTPQDIAVEILFRSIPPVDGVAQQPERRVIKWDHVKLQIYISLDPVDGADPAPLKAMLRRYFDAIHGETNLSISYIADPDKADIWINYKRAFGLEAYVKRLEQAEGVVCFGNLFHRIDLTGETMAPIGA